MSDNSEEKCQAEVNSEVLLLKLIISLWVTLVRLTSFGQNLTFRPFARLLLLSGKFPIYMVRGHFLLFVLAPLFSSYYQVSLNLFYLLICSLSCLL